MGLKLESLSCARSGGAEYCCWDSESIVSVCRFSLACVVVVGVGGTGRDKVDMLGFFGFEGADRRVGGAR